jgi:hypothetical protein
MKFSSSLLSLGVGAVMGIAFVLSCGDDSPRKADAGDAATCTCPPSEPPLAARLTYVERPFTVPANSVAQEMDAVCPGNDIAISGGCGANLGQSPDILIEQSYPGGQGWVCVWRNPSNAPVPVRAIVRCLTPAQ